MTTTLDCGCVGGYRNGFITCIPCDQHPPPFYSTAELVRLFAPSAVRNRPLFPHTFPKGGHMTTTDNEHITKADPVVPGTLERWMEEEGCAGCAENLHIALDAGNVAAAAAIARESANHIRSTGFRDGQAEGTAIALDRWADELGRK